jgi:hypothetical protein
LAKSKRRNRKAMKQTPKEKAKVLYENYYIIIQNIGGELGQEILVSILAEQCALFFASQMQAEKWLQKKYKAYEYWQEVEVEIVNYANFKL